MRLEPGQVYGGKYLIVLLIGQVGLVAVYDGESIRIHRRVALKTLHAGLAANAGTAQRFEREAQAAGRIGSAHIVEVLDAGELPDGDRFLVMEHLEGITLQQRIRERGRLPPAEAAPVVHELLEGLGAAHQAGIIHRDLKPANVFLVRSQAGQPDFVKILDFGVSKFNIFSAEEASMTRTGAVLGTPFYMSPEQAKGSREVDARSDVYAVGVILYECITGQVPFHAETFNELIFKIVLDAPLPPESYVPDLDPGFAAILRRAMAREAAERFQSALELQQALGDWIVRSAGGTRATPASLAGPAPGAAAQALPPRPAQLPQTPNPRLGAQPRRRNLAGRNLVRRNLAAACPLRARGSSRRLPRPCRRSRWPDRWGR
ncbi:MAG: serine/threonine-protein kinase [Polyangiaceae bacterium]